MLATALISGLGLGSIYGLIALGFTLTFSVSGTVNFAQGSSVMLGAVLCHALFVGMHWPFAAAAPFALLGCALWGLVVERIAVRPFVVRRSNAWLMATVALGILLENSVMALFGKEPRALPSSLADEPWVIGNAGVFPLQIIIPIVALGLAGLVHLGMQRTSLGLKLRAAVDNPNAARLMSIDVTRLIALTFAAAAVLAGIGGILIAPLFNVAYDMGTLFGIKAFAVAILGGLTNPWGVVIAGLAYGLVEAFATTWLGSSSTQMITFAAVIAALALAPSGLFGGKALARV
ncbi:MAG: branched-chain amino acid transport system permease protein [Methylobacteriaceae bacterium]|jgi:branched-chain amino acid transport system permease protein|nr:branched-chain amino acid transport system permease protein [Methylobacteriaceae bacterium]